MTLSIAEQVFIMVIIGTLLTILITIITLIGITTTALIITALIIMEVIIQGITTTTIIIIPIIILLVVITQILTQQDIEALCHHEETLEVLKTILLSLIVITVIRLEIPVTQ